MWLQFSTHMSNLIKWKSRPCPFKRSPHVLQYLLLAATYSEKSKLALSLLIKCYLDMLLLSFEYESADTSVERDQLKKIT
jgi:hypothetical protein